MLVVIALDANNQLYPMVFAVVDYKNSNAWMYFKLKLKEAIGEVENLVFVFNQHISIPHALSIIFPKAHHGVCVYHIKINNSHKFKTDHCDDEFNLVAYSYRVSDFNHHFEKIKVNDPRIATYLDRIGVEK